MIHYPQMYSHTKRSRHYRMAKPTQRNKDSKASPSIGISPACGKELVINLIKRRKVIDVKLQQARMGELCITTRCSLTQKRNDVMECEATSK